MTFCFELTVGKFGYKPLGIYFQRVHTYMECFHRVQAKNQPRRAETLTSELRVAENVVMSLCRRSSIVVFVQNYATYRSQICTLTLQHFCSNLSISLSLIRYTTITRIKITVVPGYMASRDVRELEEPDTRIRFELFVVRVGFLEI